MTVPPQSAPAEAPTQLPQTAAVRGKRIDRWVDNWNRFWFEPTTPVAMALFRIFFGIILLENMLIHLLPDFDLYYGKNSLIPINDMMSLYWHSSYYFDLMAALPDNDKYIYGCILGDGGSHGDDDSGSLHPSQLMGNILITDVFRCPFPTQSKCWR
jgi:hypothetical protein